MKHLLLFIISAFIFNGCQKSTTDMPSEKAIIIPIAGNSYITSSANGDKVGQNGIVKWSNTNTVISVFFKVSHSGELNLYMDVKSDKDSKINVSVLDKNFEITIPKGEKTLSIGAVNVISGYVRVDFKGIQKEGNEFAHIEKLYIDGIATTSPLVYVHDYETYWARRGPSVHLRYRLPIENIEYFYNEVTVPDGNDVIGSYYEANGCSEGYFGMQVNSETERRILFSVWSPYNTENPKDIPEDKRVKMLRKGKNVHIGEFGNEGSGGQSYLIYPWKTDNTYRFLTQVCPDGKGNTIYTSYFFAPEENEWYLIASFLRPKTNTWYTNAYSFLENFIPEQGWITRRGLFGNQWARTSEGVWSKITVCTFTYDATAKAGVRTDYQGGTDGDCFYLQNCGFFNESTPLDSFFKVSGNSQTAPDIDFEKLKQL